MDRRPARWRDKCPQRRAERLPHAGRTSEERRLNRPSAPPRTQSQAAWFTVLALCAGLVTAASVVDVGPRLNIVVVGALIGAAVLTYAADRLTLGDIGLAVMGFVLLAMFAVSDSELLLFADLCAAAGLASFAVHGGTGWSDVFFGGFAVLGRLHRSLQPVTRWARTAWSGFDRVAHVTWLRGGIVGLVLATVFVLLFSS